MATKGKNAAKRARRRSAAGPKVPNLVSETMRGWAKVPVGLTPEFRSRLRYTSYINMSPASGAMASQLVSGNSAYDPDATGVGSQPYWFDELATIYTKYRVVRSKIKLTLVNTGAVHFRAVLMPLYATSGPSDTYQALEYPLAKSVTLGINTSGEDVAHMSHSCDTAKAVGVSQQAALIEDGYAGAYNGSPAFRWYWLIVGSDVGGYTTTPSVTVEYQIVYDIIWSGFRAEGDSLPRRVDVSALLAESRQRVLSQAPKYATLAPAPRVMEETPSADSSAQVAHSARLPALESSAAFPHGCSSCKHESLKR
jgi:hypothetical protein